MKPFLRAAHRGVNGRTSGWAVVAVLPSIAAHYRLSNSAFRGFDQGSFGPLNRDGVRCSVEKAPRSRVNRGLMRLNNRGCQSRTRGASLPLGRVGKVPARGGQGHDGSTEAD